MTGVAVVSADGLVIEQAIRRPTDPEALAALATTLVRHGRELGEAADLGGLGAAVLEFDTGPALLCALRDGASLLLLGALEADLGELLYLLRRHRAAIADLL